MIEFVVTWFLKVLVFVILGVRTNYMDFYYQFVLFKFNVINDYRNLVRGFRCRFLSILSFLEKSGEERNKF